MISDQFRRELRSQAKLWQAEGLIDTSLYQQLADRYQFHTLESASRNRFLGILISLGSILLALGVITFVAANWQVWSREARVVLLLSLFVAVNAAGFYLWRIPPSRSKNSNPNLRLIKGRNQLLGEGLLLLGSLILGANMALMAQMFHIGGSAYGLFLAWGIGVLGMAYSLRLTSLGVLSALLVGLGYWLAVLDWSSKVEFSWLALLVRQMPIAASIMFIPLAYWCRSRAIFCLGAIVLIFSLQASIVQGLNPSWGAAIFCALPPALLWGYDDAMWPNIDSRLFQPTTRSLALIFLAGLFYFFSFHWLWQDSPAPSQISLDWSVLTNVVFLGALTVFEWLHLGRLELRRPKQKGLDLTTGAIAIAIVISALIPFYHLNVSPLPQLATFLFNVLLFLLAVGLIREGLALGNRRSFWGGMVLITLQIISRLFEYNTELLLKSFVFVLCGIGVIAAGLWFERHFATIKDE
ncbi:MAG: DUF2157 domain-containing protein [Oscillatoriales cyanobacterium]|uniref:DUF2157 domain-containing protein n=1 Tax=Microcoleus anatoxicus TaxID=2705319 RepID=UPI002979FF28|nr:MAG: DUF2157 domain-containing protein [Oscillatoriales cyanobacterium]TAF69476.1 MAG: DUF2157 domain-containing protein [Oscillatoriales cyanobacterium]